MTEILTRAGFYVRPNPDFNVGLADQVLALIEANPDTWDQRTWAVKRPIPGEQAGVCQTAFCFAGHAVIVAGYRLRWETRGLGRQVAEFCDEPDTGDVRGIGGAAADLLGLSIGEADALFYITNTLDELHTIVDALAGRIPEPVS